MPNTELSIIDSTTVFTPMTAEEAHNTHNQLRHLHNVVRSLLLKIRDHKGYLHLGYQSFADYGEKEWGYSPSYIHRLATAHATQQLVAPNSPDIPETQLRPLASVPDVDKKRIYDEVQAQCAEDHKKITAKLITEAVDKYRKVNLTLHFKLEKIENELSTDFQAKIDHLNDQLSRSKELLAQSQSEKKEVDTLVVKRNDLLTQIDILNTELSEKNQQKELKKQQDDYNTTLRLFYTNVRSAISHTNLELLEILSDNDLIDTQTHDQFVSLSELIEQFLTNVRSVRVSEKNQKNL